MTGDATDDRRPRVLDCGCELSVRRPRWLLRLLRLPTRYLVHPPGAEPVLLDRDRFAAYGARHDDVACAATAARRRDVTDRE